jgi:hypothetical protein
MAIPNEELSIINLPADYVGGRALYLDITEDFESGGIALNDPSQGYMVQVWRTTIVDGNTIVTEAQDTGVVTTVYTGVDKITEVSLSFDQNMRQVIAFVEGDIAKLDWYDTQIEARVLSEFPGISNPRVSLDDKRLRRTPTSDVIFSYLRNTNLYFRMQRDRYGVEYLLKEGAQTDNNLILRRTGLNTVNRFQWEFFDPWTQEEILGYTLSTAADPTTESNFASPVATTIITQGVTPSIWDRQPIIVTKVLTDPLGNVWVDSNGDALVDIINLAEEPGEI